MRGKRLSKVYDGEAKLNCYVDRLCQVLHGGLEEEAKHSFFSALPHAARHGKKSTVRAVQAL
jgi:hypothetical protein